MRLLSATKSTGTEAPACRRRTARSRHPARALLCSVWTKNRHDVPGRGLPLVRIPVNALRAEPRAFAVVPLGPAGGNCKSETARIRTTIEPGRTRRVAVRGAVTCEFKSFALGARLEYFDTHLSTPARGHWSQSSAQLHMTVVTKRRFKGCDKTVGAAPRHLHRERAAERERNKQRACRRNVTDQPKSCSYVRPYWSSPASTLPVARFMRCTRLQAGSHGLVRSPSSTAASSANHPCTFRPVVGHRQKKTPC